MLTKELDQIWMNWFWVIDRKLKRHDLAWWLNWQDGKADLETAILLMFITETSETFTVRGL